MTASRASRRAGNRRRSWTLRIALLFALSLLLTPGCSDERLINFRDAAATGLQSGVNSILDGVVNGLFAAFLSETPAAE